MQREEELIKYTYSKMHLEDKALNFKIKYMYMYIHKSYTCFLVFLCVQYLLQKGGALCV